ncbi:MAG: pyridoxamine 5'-phosphate oxidase family protein [Desulfovibrionaceae bacterium]
MRKGITDDFAAAAAVLDQCDVLHLAFADAAGPHAVPVNFARRGRTILIHSSFKGRKAEALSAGAAVAVSAVARAELRTGEKACQYGYRFASAVGHGRARRVDGEAERRAALELIIQRYAKGLPPVDEAILAKTALFAIDLDDLCARVRD